MWSVAQHPAWLVFEVEQGLQIRPDQYNVAKRLLQHDPVRDGPAPITQLNMGEGVCWWRTRLHALPCIAARCWCWC